jgi:hypothetical protein
MGAAFETVGKNSKLPTPDHRPIEIEEIVVRRIDPFAAIEVRGEGAGEGGIDGLQMAVVKKKGSPVRGFLNERHSMRCVTIREQGGSL